LHDVFFLGGGDEAIVQCCVVAGQRKTDSSVSATWSGNDQLTASNGDQSRRRLSDQTDGYSEPSAGRLMAGGVVWKVGGD
jgi:hypothetical protein